MSQKILFIHSGLMSFVQEDISLLSQDFELLVYHYQSSKSVLKNAKAYFQQFFWLLVHIWQAKSVFVWFGDYHSFCLFFFLKLHKKKSIIVVGGYDATYIKEIKYGVFSHFIRSFCAKFTYLYANHILTVDESLKTFLLQRIPTLANKITTVHTGYDSLFWKPLMPKENSVLTVANIKDYQTFKRKGIDFFIEVAHLLPAYKFVIVGKNCELNEWKNLPSNVEIYGKMDKQALRNMYSKSKVYAQFSVFEGLPNVLCEAMLCECVPVGSNICGIPTAIGRFGYIVSSPIEAAHAITLAMSQEPSDAGRMAIKNTFTLEKRKAALLGFCDIREKGF